MSVTVQRGDTLTSIARRNKTTVQELLKANPEIKNPNLIRPGQELRLQGWDGKSAFEPPVKAPVAVKAPTAPAAPPRPDLKQIQRDYQTADDRVVAWRPAGGLGWPGVGKEYSVTATEGKLLDKLGHQRGFWGQKQFSDIKDRALETSERMFPAPSTVPGYVPADRKREWIGNDGQRDAFRHACWNALLTREFGADWTRQFTTAHEGLPGNPADREAMDLYNNEVGRQIALASPDASPEKLAELVAQAVKDGKMVVIDPKGGLNWSDKVPLWQHGLTDGVAAGGGQPVPDGNASVI